MKKIIKKIYKNTLNLAKVITSKNFEGITDEDVDNLAECINVLEDIYEELYDKVYDDSVTVCKGTPDQL